jgi:NADH dehydrogenase [ubiquinone] 1 alpha subcomplex assembly factor 7
VTPLAEKLQALIAAQGPLSVAEFMQIALADLEHGFYMRADPLGRDFITAPEISQIFGELIALFFLQAWEDRGRPERFQLVELGPGRGTLMADLVRTAGKLRPEFLAGAEVTLVETSPVLRAAQARALGELPVRWADRLTAVPEGQPLFLLANEFFDALPIRQFVASETGWHERRIARDGDGFGFVVAPSALPFSQEMPGSEPGAVLERNAGAEAIMSEIGTGILRDGGVALVIDYGHSGGFGDTLQAMRGGHYADVLAEPGAADLTAHVDFAALARAAGEARVSGPVTQAAFLDALGIGLRAERLKQLRPELADEIGAAVDRLIAPSQMGTLFKALALAQPGSPPLPGFP